MAEWMIYAIIAVWAFTSGVATSFSIYRWNQEKGSVGPAVIFLAFFFSALLAPLIFVVCFFAFVLDVVDILSGEAER